MWIDSLILLVFTLLLGTPLVFLRATPDDLPQVVFLLWGSVLVSALLLVRNLTLRRQAFPSRRVLLATLVFACVRAAGAFASPSLDAALSDLSMLAGCIVVAVLVLLDRPIAEHMEQRGLPLLVVVAAAASALGVLQHYGIDLVRGDERRLAVSTLGNVNFAGAFACALLPLCLAILVSPRERGIRVTMLLCAPLLVWEAVLSGSRGVWLAGLAGLCLFSAFLMFGRVPPSVRRLRRPAAAIGVCFLLVTLGLGASTEAGKRLFAVFAAGGRPSEVRPQLWAGTLRMIRDAPWLGHGTGGFRSAYVPYRDVDEAILSGDASQVEDPHCEPLRLAAENGTVGLLAGLLLLAAAASSARQALAREGGLSEHLLAVGLIASLAALLAFGLVNPLGKVPALSFTGWLLVASLAALRTGSKGETRVYRPSRGALAVCALPGLLGLVAVALLATGRLREVLLLDEAHDASQVAAQERLLREAARTSPDAHFELAVLYSDPRVGEFPRAAAHARAAVEAEPWNGHHWAQLGACEGKGGRLDEAEAAYLQALRLEPGYWVAHAGLAYVRHLQGREEEAREEEALAQGILARQKERQR